MSSDGSFGKMRIEKRLETLVPLIDIDDYENRPQQKTQAALSRALAAYCVKCLANTTNELAAASITDRFFDRGLDAIFYDSSGSQLLLVQAKWSNGIGWKEAGEFTDGVCNLIAPNWPAFSKNDKITARRNEIATALASSVKLVLISVCVGAKPADASVLRRIDDCAKSLDETGELVTTVHWFQSSILAAIASEADPPKVTASIYLSHWGEVKTPHHAIYGRMQGSHLAELWKQNAHLSHRNLRDYNRRTDVNAAIGRTISDEPEEFWYFNNGLTLICDSIKPAVLGLGNHEVSLFTLHGVSLVNGAQTAGVIADKLSLVDEEERAKLWIQVRAIAVNPSAQEFERKVTKYTNLQNAIGIQDFVSLDPTQSRIATDFAIAKRRYAFRWGGSDSPVGDAGCTLREATVALACADIDLWFAVQAKREISVLWDTESAAYKRIFHETLTATRIWNAVKIMRAADQTTGLKGLGSTKRADMVAANLQRLVLYVVFQDPSLFGWDVDPDSDAAAEKARLLAAGAFDRIQSYVNSRHQNEYLASLSKNLEKCRQVAAFAIQKSETYPNQQKSLDFGDS